MDSAGIQFVFTYLINHYKIYSKLDDNLIRNFFFKCNLATGVYSFDVTFTTPESYVSDLSDKIKVIDAEKSCMFNYEEKYREEKKKEMDILKAVQEDILRRSEKNAKKEQK